MRARLTSKGQITIPAEIREELNLKQGDTIEFQVEEGTLIMTPKTGTFDDLINCLPKSEVSYSVEEINDAIAQAACDAGTRY